MDKNKVINTSDTFLESAVRLNICYDVFTFWSQSDQRTTYTGHATCSRIYNAPTHLGHFSSIACPNFRSTLSRLAEINDLQTEI